MHWSYMLDEISSSGSSSASQIGWCAPRKSRYHEPELAHMFPAHLFKRSAQDVYGIGPHTKACLIYGNKLFNKEKMEIRVIRRIQAAYFEF
jgi:hypothetical protein